MIPESGCKDSNSERHPPNLSTTFLQDFFKKTNNMLMTNTVGKELLPGQSRRGRGGKEEKAGNRRKNQEKTGKEREEKIKRQRKRPGKKKSRLLQQTAHLYNNKVDL